MSWACSRCSRPYVAEDPDEWNLTMRKGRVVGMLCPDCQTPEENAEAVMNEAITDYSTMHRDENGLWRAKLKTEGDD